MFSQSGRMGQFLNLIKNTYKICTGGIMLNNEKLTAFLLRSGIKQGFPFSPIFHILLIVLVNVKKTRKENKSYASHRENIFAKDISDEGLIQNICL